MTINVDQFMESLVSSNQDVKKIRDEQVAYDGEVLSYVLFSEIVRYVVHSLSQASTEAKLKPVFEAISTGFEMGDDEVKYLIGTEFLQALMGTNVDENCLPHLSVRLQDEYKLIANGGN